MTGARSCRSLIRRRPSGPALRQASRQGAHPVNGSITIAVDAMGGDRAPAMVLQGADIALERDPNARFLLFGDEARIAPLLAMLPRLASAATIHHTPDVVLNDAKPSVALRAARRSSMRLA